MISKQIQDEKKKKMKTETHSENFLLAGIDRMV